MLHAALGDAAPGQDVGEVARQCVDGMLRAGQPIPGIGHPVHKPIDPRTPALFAIARECGHHGRYVALMEGIAAEAGRRTGKTLPVNATGAIGALACELGLDPRICRGLAVIGRAVGLVGHLAEELQQPIARPLWEATEAAVAASAAAVATGKPAHA